MTRAPSLSKPRNRYPGWETALPYGALPEILQQQMISRALSYGSSPRGISVSPMARISLEIKLRSGTARALSASHDTKSTHIVPVTRLGHEAAECRAKPILEIVPPRPATEHHILSREIASKTVSIRAR